MPNYLVIGGISSGKSSYAEQIVKDICKLNKNSKIYYLATAPITDDEMYEKIRIHQDRRPKDWTTVEEEIDIISRIIEIEETNIIVLIEKEPISIIELNCFIIYFALIVFSWKFLKSR